MVYSASMVKALDAGKPATDFFTDQLLYVVFGAACALFLWKVVPYRFWVGPIVWAVWAVAVALIFAVWLAGTDHYGAQRWLYIGPIGLQPSEFCKIAFILVAVRLVVDWWAGLVESRATMVRALIFIIAPIALMYRTQSDLGTTAICFVGILAVMWMGGVSRRVIFACLGVAVLGGLVAIFGTGYRSDRLVFMDPWNDGEGGYGTGYNIIRSYYALAEGGIFGVGLGNSHEKFQYLFASESDFIFAVIGEELGLVGALFVIGLFFCVLYAGLAIAERASDDIGAMIAGGATVMLVFQAFLNIACVIGVFPTTGKPLPFISSRHVHDRLVHLGGARALRVRGAGRPVRLRAAPGRSAARAPGVGAPCAVGPGAVGGVFALALRGRLGPRRIRPHRCFGPIPLRAPI